MTLGTGRTNFLNPTIKKSTQALQSGDFRFNLLLGNVKFPTISSRNTIQFSQHDELSTLQT